MAVHPSAVARAMALLAGLGLAFQPGCSDRELPTGVMSFHPAFTQTQSSPVVNILNDETDTSGCDDTHCSLREAIAYATSGATINFDPALTAGGAATITLTGGQLSISGKDLAIAGPGAQLLTVRAGGTWGVFSIEEAITVSLSGLTITGGNSGYGGGIDTWDNSLTLTNCVVTGNQASYYGGGIQAYDASLTLIDCVVSGNQSGWEGAGIFIEGGTVSLTRTTVSGNQAGRAGGGLHMLKGDAPTPPTVAITKSSIQGNSADGDGGGINQLDGDLTVTASTLSNNTAAYGGAIHTNAGDASAFSALIMNSTISGNSVTYDGGGVASWWGPLQIVLSTITGNHAGGDGSGVFSETSETVIKSSLIWGNTRTTGGAADDVARVSGQPFTSLGYNLIGTAGANVDLGTEFNATRDQTGITSSALVQLGPLADNTGETYTHALLQGSVAVDAGSCFDHTGATVTTDQRGVTRPQGDDCDVGAFEGVGLSGLPTPDFTFDLALLPAKTYGNGQFSVAEYASSTASSGAKSFGTSSGSVGCSVTAAGMVTLTGAAQGTHYCILTATLAPTATHRGVGPLTASFQIGKAALTVTANDVPVTFGDTPQFGVGYSGFVGSDNAASLGGTVVYTFEGISPTSYGPSTTAPTNAGIYSITPSGLTSNDYTFTYVPGTLTIAKAAGSVTINNLPSYAPVGGSFTPTYVKLGDGTPSATSQTPAVCSVDGAGAVHYVSDGACNLVVSITAGTNHLSATREQGFTVAPAPFYACTYLASPKNGSYGVTVTWRNAVPGVTKIIVTDGRTITKQLAPTATGSWNTTVRSGVPSYELWGGTSRKDSSTQLKARTACEVFGG